MTETRTAPPIRTDDDPSGPGDDALVARYVEPDALNRGPEEAAIVDHGVAVWALMVHLEAVGHDPARAAADEGLPVEAVEADRRYYRRQGRDRRPDRRKPGVLPSITDRPLLPRQ